MSYHDNPTSYKTTGIEVVSPLLKVERKLKKIQEALNKVDDEAPLTTAELRSRLQKLLDEY
tara:strand:+ start:1122 stop:1304 length:183 start_codon:yes stop_codon:yes gene_type:complete